MRAGRRHRPAQQRQLRYEILENGREPQPGPPVGRRDLGGGAARLDYQVDRAVPEVEPPAVRQQARLRPAAGQASCALYQSTISAPDQNSTPGREAIWASIDSRYLMRCGTPLI